MRRRFVPLLVLAALAAALAVVGCGGGSGSGETEPSEAVPPGASVFVQAQIQPDGEIAENVDSLAEKVAGIDSVGALIAAELERSAADGGAKVDFEKEVQPWLGEEAGIFLQEYDGEDFRGAGAALQVSDQGEAEDFVDKTADESGETYDEADHDGVDFKTDEDGTAVGFTEGLLMYAENERIFKQMVDALAGENLAGAESFASASGDAPADSVADVYVDIGALIQETGEGIDDETRLGLELLGIEPEGSTALISLVPGAETLEMDISSNLTSGAAAGGDASGLLGSLPAGSVAAVASADYGQALQQMIDQIDEEGIAGEVPPNKFKSSLEESGIDIESIIGSIGDVGVFVEGNSESNLGGALVIESGDSNEAQNTVKNLGLLLRASGVPGITAFKEGSFSGFSVSSPELGEKPLVVAAGGSKVAISYGPEAAAAALSEGAGTLGDDPAFAEAKAALGDTPISGFLAGAPALELFETLASPLDVAKLDQVRPYLEKLGWIALGGESSGDSTSAKLVAGLAK
ncbi:MAG: DUF3352 domain-containing protein [Solirubrobacterales bacterium]